jgi:hypothetical protein
MRFFIGDPIPGLSEAVARAMPNYEDGVLQSKDGKIGKRALILGSDKWLGPKVTIQEVLDSVAAQGFTGPRVENHVAFLCKTDPRVVQSGIVRIQRASEAALKGPS